MASILSTFYMTCLGACVLPQLELAMCDAALSIEVWSWTLDFPAPLLPITTPSQHSACLLRSILNIALLRYCPCWRATLDLRHQMTSSKDPPTLNVCFGLRSPNVKQQGPAHVECLLWTQNYQTLSNKSLTMLTSQEIACQLDSHPTSEVSRQTEEAGPRVERIQCPCGYASSNLGDDGGFGVDMALGGVFWGSGFVTIWLFGTALPE
eukprot:245078-Pelagomonas_calceolata.AAC.4